MSSWINSTKPNTSYGGDSAPISFGSYVASPSTAGASSGMDWKVALIIGVALYLGLK